MGSDREVADLESQADALAASISSPPTTLEDLNLSVNSSELLVRALQFTADGSDKVRLSKKCDALLRQAERVKAKLQTPVAANVGMDKQVEAKRKATSRDPFEGLSTREKVILLRGSKLNGFTFPPWQCSPDTAEFAMADGEQRFLRCGFGLA